MTDQTTYLTAAEAAVAEALRANPYGCHLNDEVCDECAESFRAVAAAVEPHYTIAALEATVRDIEQFAARKRRAGHRRDAVGIDEAAELVLDELRALRARQSLSRPTAEEQ